MFGEQTQTRRRPISNYAAFGAAPRSTGIQTLEQLQRGMPLPQYPTNPRLGQEPGRFGPTTGTHPEDAGGGYFQQVTPAMRAQSQQLYGGLHPGAGRYNGPTTPAMMARSRQLYGGGGGIQPPLGLYPAAGGGMGDQDGGWFDEMHALKGQMRAAQAAPSYFSRQMAAHGLSGPQIPGGLAAYAPGGDFFGAQQGMAQPGLTRQGYMDTMAGAHFQGATPGMVAYGGGQRQGFLGPGMPEQTAPPIRDISRASTYMEGVGMVPPSAHELGAMGAMGMGPSQYANYQQRMGTPENPSQYALDNRNAAAANRMFGANQRRANVQQKAMNREEARRFQAGNLSMHEQAMFGIPGYAEANIGAGVAHAQLGAQERMFGGAMQQQNLDRQQKTELANLHTKHEEMHWAHEQALQEGKHAAAQHLQEGINSTQKEIAKLEGKGQLKAARQAGQTQKDVATINKEPAMADVHARERESLLKMGEFYRQQAQEAIKSGDMAGYQEHIARSNDFMHQAGQSYFNKGGQTAAGGQAPAPGAPTGSTQQMFGGGGQPRNWASLPLAMRQQLAGKTPQEMVNNLRSLMPHLTQQEADQMIQDAHGPNHVTQYNPSGYGASDAIGAFTGLENINRWSRWFSGRGPKPPTMNIGLGKWNPPVPVMPGPFGVASTAAGY